MGANCCDLPLLAHVVLAHVALVYTVWTLTGVLNSLAHPVMSITTFTALSETIILDIPLLPLALASETQQPQTPLNFKRGVLKELACLLQQCSLNK